MNKFKVSVVVPVYNTRRKYLEQCVNSIVKQTYKPYEIIIVDDGSTRVQTLKALKQIEKKGVACVIHQNNRKISGALNTGIRNMKGNWWAGCSSDDVWFPYKLEEQVKYAKKHPHAKVIYANWVMIDKDGYLIGRVEEPEFFDIKAQQLHLMYRGYFATWSNMLVHKSVFEKVGLFNEAYPTSEDYEMNVRMSQYYLFYKVHRYLMMYRKHSEQLSESQWGWKGKKGQKYTQKAMELARKLFGGDGQNEGNYNRHTIV